MQEKAKNLKIKERFFTENIQTYFSIKENSIPNIYRYLEVNNSKNTKKDKNMHKNNNLTSEEIRDQVQLYQKKLEDAIHRQFCFVSEYTKTSKLPDYVTKVTSFWNLVMEKILNLTDIRFYFDIELMQVLMANILNIKNFPLGALEFKNLINFNQRYQDKNLSEVTFSPEIIEYDLFYIAKFTESDENSDENEKKNLKEKNASIVASFYKQYLEKEKDRRPENAYCIIRVFMFYSKGNSMRW